MKKSFDMDCFAGENNTIIMDDNNGAYLEFFQESHPEFSKFFGKKIKLILEIEE